MIDGARRCDKSLRRLFREPREHAIERGARQRLGEKIAGSAAHRLHARFHRTVTGHHDDIGAFRQPFMQELDAFTIGQSQVDHAHVRGGIKAVARFRK